jgi:hypothetical protein
MMKNKVESEDEITRKWIKEAGTEYPGDTFQISILKKIKELDENRVIYQPVISALGWKLILIYVASIVGLSTFSNPSNSTGPTFLDKLPPIKLPTFQLNLAEITNGWLDFSPQFTLGITIFLCLGFVMALINLRHKQTSL